METVIITAGLHEGFKVVVKPGVERIRLPFNDTSIGPFSEEPKNKSTNFYSHEYSRVMVTSGKDPKYIWVPSDWSDAAINFWLYQNKSKLTKRADLFFAEKLDELVNTVIEDKQLSAETVFKLLSKFLGYLCVNQINDVQIMNSNVLLVIATFLETVDVVFKEQNEGALRPSEGNA
jgi:hypothetical protein